MREGKAVTDPLAPDDDLRLTGHVRALYVALIAAIDAHPHPASIAALVHSAIEHEIAQALPEKVPHDEWIAGMQEMQLRLAEMLLDKYGEA